MENSRQRRLSRFLTLFFSLLYHQLSVFYDLVAWLVSLGRWGDWVRTALPYLEGSRILELGHGTGHLQVELHRAGKQPFGIDESWNMNKLALKRLRRNRIQARILSAYAQSLPFSAHAFDRIVATFPSEYIYDPQTTSEIFRLLMPGGKLIVLPAAWITGAALLDRLAAGLFRVTHQAPLVRDAVFLSHVSSPFQQAGFQVKIEMVNLVRSEVLVLIASKPA